MYLHNRSSICLCLASPWQSEASMLHVACRTDWLDGLNSMERSQEAWRSVERNWASVKEKTVLTNYNVGAVITP
jgi:hypothetical protein